MIGQELEHDDNQGKLSLSKVLNNAIQEKKWITEARHLFEHLDTDQDGKLNESDFINGLGELSCDKSDDELSRLFVRL